MERIPRQKVDTKTWQVTKKRRAQWALWDWIEHLWRNLLQHDRNNKRRLSFLSKRSQSPVISLDKMRVAKRKKRSVEASIDPDNGKFNYDHVTGGVMVDLSLVSPEISRNGIENVTRLLSQVSAWRRCLQSTLTFAGRRY
eukprot:scaffold9598_cov46-Attheya_sp.AAC.1